VRKAAEILAGRGAVVQLNSDENPALAARFGVTGIPALFSLRKGRVVDRQTGAMSADALVNWFHKTLLQP